MTAGISSRGFCPRALLAGVGLRVGLRFAQPPTHESYELVGGALTHHSLSTGTVRR